MKRIVLADLRQKPTDDTRWMRAALRFASRNIGLSTPNPSVCAVVFSEYGNIKKPVSCAVTAQGGRPHAEYIALKSAGFKAKGGTLFVTLEPCGHKGRGPACVDQIIAAGIKTVVIGDHDSDARTCAQSVEKLKRNGIEVRFFENPALARLGYAEHLLFHTMQRPLVTAKLALSRSGQYAHCGGYPAAITSVQANRHSHALRAQSDAILVGGATWRTDRPRLTCRLPGLSARSPQIIVTSNAPSPGPDMLWPRNPETNTVWITTGHPSPSLPAPYKPLPVNLNDDGIDLHALLSDLAHRGIRRLLIEGGPHLLNIFMRAGLVDRFWLWQSRNVLLEKDAPDITGFDQLQLLCRHHPDFVQVDTYRLADETLNQFHARAFQNILDGE